MATKKPRTSGELKSIVRANKRARGLVLMPEIWVLPEQRPRLDALLDKLKREQAAQARLA